MRGPRYGRDRKSFGALGLWLIASCCWASPVAAGGVRINEVMARNTSVEIPDERGTPIVQDWIELYNAGNAEVALSRYSLSDTRDNHDKYRFPAGSRLGPREFAIVYVVDREDCKQDCEPVADCVADALEECQDDFVDCKLVCFDEQSDCLEDAETPEERAQCRQEFADCQVDLDLCRTLRSECVDRALSMETELDCQRDRDDCIANCDPLGFVADFTLGSNETVYLFEGDRLIDRVGVTDPDIIDPDTMLENEEIEDRFFAVSVGRYPDGTGPYGVHYSGATPGAPNGPTGVAVPSISRPELTTIIPACGETVGLREFEVTVDTAQLASLEVLIEYSDDCGEGAWTTTGTRVVEEKRVELEPETRVDINAKSVIVPRVQVSYSGSVPGAECGVRRRIRVRVQLDALAVTAGTSCVVWDDDQQLPKLAINEYMPRNNTTMRFRYNQRELVVDGDTNALPVYERPDWFEVVNWGAVPLDLREFGFVGLDQWGNFQSGDRDDLTPWRLVDSRYDQPVEGILDEDDFILQPGCHLVLLADNDAPSFRQTFRPVPVRGDQERPPIDDASFPGEPDCQFTHQFGDGHELFFFSTNLALSARESTDGDEDGFVLLYKEGGFTEVDGVLTDVEEIRELDRVVIDFDAIEAQSPGLLEPPEPDDADQRRRIPADVAFGRLPLGQETFAERLRTGIVLLAPTPGRTNSLTTEVPPQFEDAVGIVPRNPRGLAPVTVRGQVNFDSGRSEAVATTVDDLVVELHYEAGEGEMGVLGIGSGLELTEAPDQDQARAASTLWDITATIPGQPDGTFVTFFLFARDDSDGGDNTEVFHGGDQEVTGVSFRYVVGFEPAIDAPKINEVLPENAETPLPPFETELEQRFRDYAEIHNPSSEPLDLSGYYLAQSPPPANSMAEVPIFRARQWRFPEGVEVAPGDLLTVYFGSVPEGYVEADFGLSCAEALYLIAPDAPELGANSIVDRVSWNLTQEDGTCEPDRSISRLCGGTSAFAEAEPTPDRPNLQNVEPLEFHSAYHSNPFNESQRNHCLPAGGLGANVNLNAVVFVDADLVALLDSDRNQPSAVIADHRIIVEREDGGEDIERGGLIYFDCGSGGQCEAAPEGQASIRIQRLYSRSGNDEEFFRYRVEATDICGAPIVAGPFTVVACDALFTRGDANGDGGINLTDGLAIVGHLFQGKPIDCPDSGDVDDNGQLNLTDAIVLLAYLFQGGAAPPAPFPDAGIDATPDDVPCRE